MKIYTKEAGKTGVKPTANVGFEQSFPIQQRIINDDLAPKLFSGMNGFWIKISKYASIRTFLVNLTEKLMPGGWSMFLVRKRYIDSKLIETIENYDIHNVVNLGAGMDTRLYRFPILQNKKCYEMDQTESVNSKRKAIVKALGVFPQYVQQVPINFIKESIDEKMKSNGYNPEEKTFFIWEAVSQYLDMPNLEKTFDFFSNSPKGSFLAFTYVLKDFVEGKNLFNQKVLYKLTVRNNLWISCFNPNEIKGFLEKYNWELIEDVSYRELDNWYVKPTGRKLGVCDVERVVFARKK
ncbi:SAM-dependent methyltransferase [Flammeovirga pectinis]|uniref:S-adenosyl-L-methionine-dependent methyltransferase n=1 Tax=Flammeovirga pectinis TaxID=2494373 RepID=A0A3S9P6Q5_9BACT|nr:SAM-dependent methyltransferase [Flammeovirga pectinis]AZQ63878.1 SAM-dependent methyltransferase [Flammeovirga pectinis]